MPTVTAQFTTAGCHVIEPHFETG